MEILYTLQFADIRFWKEMSEIAQISTGDGSVPIDIDIQSFQLGLKTVAVPT